MAILPNGINGPFIGKSGNLVGYMLNGKNIIRTIGQYKGERTEAQKANEQRLGLISTLSTKIKDFLRFGFQSVADPGKDGPKNYSVSINKEVAVKGKYPKQKTDFKKLVVAEGTIPPPLKAAVKVAETGLEFTWKADLEEEGADKTDQIMLLAYLPKSKRAIIMSSGARRTAEKEILELPEFNKETAIHTYIAYVSDDRLNASNSVYLGKMVIQPAVQQPEDQAVVIEEEVPLELAEHQTPETNEGCLPDTQEEKPEELQYTAVEATDNDAIEEEKTYTLAPQKYDQGYSELIHFGSLRHPYTERMKIISPLLSFYKDEINLGFQHGDRKTTAMNKAIKRNITDAIDGDQVYNLYYPAMVFSNGKREPAWATKLSLASGNELTVRWDVPKTAKMSVIGNDSPVFIFYNSTSKRKCDGYSTAKRKDLSDTMTIKGKPGDIIYCWMFFVSPDQKIVSDTDYLGCVEIV